MPDLIHIKSFGMISELIGSDSLEMENPGSSEALKLRLYEQYPALRSMKFTLALDKKMILSDTDISNGKEVALLPPFSGG